MNLDDLTREELVELVRAQCGESGSSDAPWRDLRLQVGELEMRNRLLQEQLAQAQEARRRYAELYDFAPVAIVIVGPDTRIEEVNLTAAALFGGSRDALIGRPLSALVVSEDRALVRAQLKRCLAGRGRVTVDVRLALDDLEAAPFQLVSTALTDGDRLLGCKCALTDVSALKRSEERLRILSRASAELARSFDVAKNIGEVVGMLVPAFADVAFVDVVDEQKRATRAEVRAASPAKRAVAEALKRAETPWVELAEPLLVTTAAPAALALVVPDGPERASIVAACDPHAVALVPVTVRDQTLGLIGLVMAESRRAYTPADLAFASELATRLAMAVDNARLFHGAQRAIRAREDVLSIVSHDLKSPLSGIRLNADLMLAASPPAERRKGRVQLERIKFATSHMERLIDDLLDLGSIDHGQLAIERRDQCLNTLVRDAHELLAPLAKEHEISLTATVPPEPVWVGCDRGRVLQVLSNLVGNALKFCPQRAAVAIDVISEDGKAHVAVRDTGPGMPPSVLRSLFQRFFQAKETAAKGRGLGLFISKNIIESQGGEIWVESQPGKGTTVHFTLPRVTPPRPPLVMVVEDDEVLREALRDLLMTHGYSVAVASDGRAALEQLRVEGGERPKVILLDLGLPVLDGREMLRELKADPALAQIPVVVISCAARLEEEASSLGAEAALKKPLDFAALLSAVDGRTLARA